LSSSGCCCQHLYTFWLLNFGAAVVVLSACSVAVTLFLCTIQLILDISTNVGTVFAAASVFAFDSPYHSSKAAGCCCFMPMLLMNSND